MANIFLVSDIFLLFYSPKGLWNKSGKNEKLENIDHIVLETVQ